MVSFRNAWLVRLSHMFCGRDVSWVLETIGSGKYAETKAAIFLRWYVTGRPAKHSWPVSPSVELAQERSLIRLVRMYHHEYFRYYSL